MLYSLKRHFTTQQFAVSIVALTTLLSLAACSSKREDLTPKLTGATTELKLVDPPNVPARADEKGPQKVVVNLTVKEEVKKLNNNATYDFWTFGGTVPGKFIRVTQGDLVEIHLHNPSTSKLPHSIDLHAVSGPGGGAEASFVAPGHTAVFSFRATTPGLFVYHCATSPVPMHVANGMYGLILVDPRAKPLPPVDHEFYIMQGEIYTTGNAGDTGLQAFDPQKGIDEKPTYVVFNGSVGSTLGPNAIRVKVGDKIRLFVGNGGPNLTSAFHIIGIIFDDVYIDGGSEVNHNVSTTAIPPGSSAIVDFTVREPGTYHIVDHSLFRAFNKGALADIIATGPQDSTIFTGQQRYEDFKGN